MMASFLEDLISRDVKFITNKLWENSNTFEKDLNEIIGKFDSYMKTKSRDNLKENCPPKDESNISNSSKVGPKKKNSVLLNGQIKIKVEKLSVASSTTESIESTGVDEEMPAPKCLPPRKRKIKVEPLDVPKRSTRTKKKPNRYNEAESESDGKESDVIVQTTAIPVVDLSSSYRENENNNKSETESEGPRPKRTRTIKKAKMDIPEAKKENEPQKKNSEEVMPPAEKEFNISDQTEYEDAVSNLENSTENVKQNETYTSDNKSGTSQNVNNPNATFVASAKTAIIDETVVVENPKVAKTPDEETVEPVQKTPQKKKNTKEIFSPFDKVSTKSKVQAFEKLATNSPFSKTKTGAKTGEDESDRHLKQKQGTPLGSKLTVKGGSTSKIHRLINRQDSVSSKSSLVSSQSRSALKASQAEFREREKNREEALKKREAYLQKMAEEKRKKREEKQLKAQQQRELLEKEKVRKQKEEKYKQAVEEKMQKQKEELERQRKKREELKEKRPDGMPIYMYTEPPLLPTYDCYDSDDEENHGRSIPPPEWGRESNLRRTQIVMLKLGESIKNTFFSRQSYTPDLCKIFETIDPKRLRRNSSAVWKKPPRYTIFPQSSDIHFSDDE